jgi:hypothetical protein
MKRVSIRTLMVVIVGAAIGLAGLRNANEIWAGAMLLVALAASGVAVLGAINLRGTERAWWQGFALFPGGYLVLALVPWITPELGTTLLFNSLRKVMFASADPSLSVSKTESLLFEKQRLEYSLSQIKQVVRNFNTDPAALRIASALQTIDGQLAASKNYGPRSEHFERVGHSLFALLAGLMGGTVAVWFYGKRQRVDAASGPQPGFGDGRPQE